MALATPASLPPTRGRWGATTGFSGSCLAVSRSPADVGSAEAEPTKKGLTMRFPLLQHLLPALSCWLRASCFCLLVVILGGLADDVSAAAANWQAGVAKAIITPEKPVWLAGYGTKRAPDGKLHELWMKALALEDAEGRRVVLITSDFEGVPKSMSDRVFEQLAEAIQAGTARRDVHVFAQPLRAAVGRRSGRLLSCRRGTGRAGEGIHRPDGDEVRRDGR